MTRVRLLPVLVFGLVSLLGIKILALVLDDGPASRRASVGNAGEQFARSIERARYGNPDDTITTASVPPKGDKRRAEPSKADGELPNPSTGIKPEDEVRKPLKSEPEGIRLPPPAETMPDRKTASSPAEREILEKLKGRREQIEARDREIEVRDQLLRQTERKLDDRIGQLRTLEAQKEMAAGKNDPKSRYRPLVIMYENMKPKEAARVFDRLDIKVLIDLVGHMNPRKVSEIVAAMDPVAAGKLTVAMAQLAAQGDMADQTPANASLPQNELQRLPVPAQKRN
jgi:flagellar motility protein MotE (MotC chaperone)